MRGRFVLINFFSPWCDVCQKELSPFDKLSQQVKSEKIVFLLIGENASEEELMTFKEKFHIFVPILEDETGAVAKNYEIFGHHEAFFINADGKIVGKSFGGKDWTSPNIQALIQDLLAAGE
jgi:peroxiredoxin